ncbi:DNA-binding transcriptional LysR family regulator [Loktanella ponticola]|uniref:DNA-binding transcriptional LysR family regulator n=1 Tax=Yoonia ponticola TaxID=1524255 RepID=A0A7W9BKJ8_9RHOB|nr:LysR family transcriptional regulator [Yoonia ponticola]MBB5722238.1 DNA-binding transcriptional LysR family regulator [Yoonia ponticola]
MIKSKLTLKQLEAFVQVVDTGTFRKAAAALGTTQPNISARISSLEKSLDVVLMHRDAGSVRLTDVGTTLVAAARQVIWSGEALLEVAKRQDLIKERLRLGVTELIACTWLHDFLRAFKKSYPSVSVELQVDLSREIDRSLVSGQIDLAIQTAPFSTELGGNLPLGNDRYIWVATPEIVQDIGTNPAMTDLFNHSILTHARHTQSSQELADFADLNNVSQNQIVHSSSLASCLPMAVDGMGIALLPRQIVSDAISQGRLVALNCDWTPSDLEVHARFDDKRVPRFVRHAAEIAQQIAAETRR